MFGQNAPAKRTPGTAHVAQRSAVFPARPTPRGQAGTAAVCHSFLVAIKKLHPCRIRTGLTASDASLVIAVVNATVHPPYLLLLHKLERV